MVETILTFLAMAFLADDAASNALQPHHADDLRRLQERLEREIFGGNRRVKVLWERAWEAAFISLERRFTAESERYVKWLESYFLYHMKEAGPLVRVLVEIGGRPGPVILPFSRPKDLLDSLEHGSAWSDEDRQRIHDALVLHDQLADRVDPGIAFPLPLPPGLEWDYEIEWEMVANDDRRNGGIGSRMVYVPTLKWKDGFNRIICNPDSISGMKVLQQISVASSNFVVWQYRNDLNEAVEEVGEAVTNLGWMGLFVDDPSEDPDKEDFEELWATDSGFFHSEDIRIEPTIYNPFGQGNTVEKPEPDDPIAQIWVAYQIRSVPDLDGPGLEHGIHELVLVDLVRSESPSDRGDRWPHAGTLRVLIDAKQLEFLDPTRVRIVRRALPEDLRTYSFRRSWEIERFLDNPRLL